MYTSILILSLGVICVSGGQPEVNCPAPRSPNHGQSFLYQDGQVVKFVCEPGYSLLGKEIVRCVDGQWEEPTPTCIELSIGGVEIPEQSPEPPLPVAPPRPLFNWGGSENEEEEKNSTASDDEEPLSDEARLRMIVIPRRRLRTRTSRVARVHTASQLEEEEKKRNEGSGSTTTIHLEAPPSVVYVRRTVSPGKSDSQEKSLNEQYRTASVRMTVDSKTDKDAEQLPRAAVAQNDKGEDSLRHLYWMAQHYYPREASSLVEYRSGSPLGATLSESQIQWIYSLHPELRDQYLRDLYVVRSEEAVEGVRAQAFLRRYDDAYNYYNYPYYYRQPASLIRQDVTSLYDYSCNQAGSHFVTAPKLDHAHIARYDRRQNNNHPRNHYLTAVYRCNPGYVMLDTRFTELHCSRRSWIGTEPVCVYRG